MSTPPTDPRGRAPWRAPPPRSPSLMRSVGLRPLRLPHPTCATAPAPPYLPHLTCPTSPAPPRLAPTIRLEHELQPIEAQVLSLRYGLEDGAQLSWKQIAARCDMPEKQAQLAQSRALRKLRKQRALRQLQTFCDHEDWELDALGRMSPGQRLGSR